MTEEEKCKSAYACAQIAEAHRINGFLEEALAEFNRAISLDNNYVWAYAHYGATYATMGSYAKALHYLTKAIDNDEKYAWAYAHRGEAYRLRADNQRFTEYSHYEKDIEDALADFSKAIRLNNGFYSWAYAHRGATYRLRLAKHKHLSDPWKEDWHRAVDDLQTATKQNSTYAWAYAFLSTLHKLAGDFLTAFKYLEEALHLDSSVVTSPAAERAALNLYARKYKKSLDYAQIALKEDPNDMIALYCLAVSRWQLNLPEKNHLNPIRAKIREAIASNMCSLSGLEILQNNGKVNKKAKNQICRAFRENPAYTRERIRVDPMLQVFKDFDPTTECKQ